MGIFLLQRKSNSFALGLGPWGGVKVRVRVRVTTKQRNLSTIRAFPMHFPQPFVCYHGQLSQVLALRQRFLLSEEFPTGRKHCKRLVISV